MLNVRFSDSIVCGLCYQNLAQTTDGHRMHLRDVTQTQQETLTQHETQLRQHQQQLQQLDDALTTQRTTQERQQTAVDAALAKLTSQTMDQRSLMDNQRLQSERGLNGLQRQVPLSPCDGRRMLPLGASV